MIYHILFKPDLFLRNMLKEAFGLLEDEQIKIIGCSLIKPDLQLLNNMYLYEFKWEYDYFYHNVHLYELGPCFSLVCDIEFEKINVIRDLKGAALPSKLNDCSLRGRLKVKNRCINAIHMADTVENSQKEIEAIYHTKYITYHNTVWNYERIEKYLLDFLIENYASRNKEITGIFVLQQLLARIQYYINTCLTLRKNKNDDTILKYDVGFKQLLEVTNVAVKALNTFDFTQKLRFFEFFWKVLDTNMIYYNEFERYYIQSEILYSDV